MVGDIVRNEIEDVWAWGDEYEIDEGYAYGIYGRADFDYAAPSSITRLPTLGSRIRRIYRGIRHLRLGGRHLSRDIYRNPSPI